jgi:hypothetical protein
MKHNVYDFPEYDDDRQHNEHQKQENEVLKYFPRETFNMYIQTSKAFKDNQSIKRNIERQKYR